MKPLVFIVWEDHHEPDKDAWDDPTPPGQLGPVLVETAGFVVSENDSVVEIARDIYEDKGELSCGAFLQILKKCIVKRHEITRP